MKWINKILLGVMTLTLLLPNTVFAIGNDDVRKMNEEEKIILQYVYVDQEGVPVYKRDKALEDNVDKTIIEVADEYYRILNSYYVYENDHQTRASIPVYGNWCGPGYGSGTPIDLLDMGCQSHDACYGERGYHKCSCDLELAAYIDRTIGNMSGTQKVMAKAVRTWARNKGENVDSNGEGSATSCVL